MSKENKSNINNLMASPIKDRRRDFFGELDISEETLIENIKEVRVEREKTVETEINVNAPDVSSSIPENTSEITSDGIIKIKSNALSEFTTLKSRERRFVSIDTEILDVLDAIEKSIKDIYSKKYGKEMKAKMKSDILNKILKAGLLSAVGIEVE